MQLILWLLLLVNIASAGLVTGGVMTMAMAYAPLLAGLSTENTLLIHRDVSRFIDRWQPKLSWIALVSGLAELVVVGLASANLWTFGAVVVGIAGIAGLMVISVTTNIPLVKQIITWTISSPYPLEQLKARWIQAHYWRSASSLLGFLSFILAFLSVGFLK